MEYDTTSRHAVLVYRVFTANRGIWYTSHEVAALSGVAYRTARQHTSRLAKLGVLEQAKLFPGYQFRLIEKAGKPAQMYVARLEKAAEILGL